MSFLMVLLASHVALAAPEAPPRQITVTGEAVVQVVPDEVVLTLGVESNQKTLAAARRQNEEAVRSLLAVTDAAGISRKQVQTDHVSIEPRYDSSRYDQRIVVGYTVRRNVVVTLRDVAGFDALLANALEAGANHVHGIQFRTSQLRRHRDKARALAIEAAREKAAAMAGGLGMGIGRPSTITEGHLGWWSSYNSGWGGNRYSQMTQNVMQAPEPESAPPQGDTMAPGTIAITARVTVVFDLVDVPGSR